MMKSRPLLVSLCSLLLSLVPSYSQDFLNFQESPPASGLQTDTQESSYSSTGLANGRSWLLNAEAGDKLSFHVETQSTSGSYPRLRISNSEGTALTDIGGSSDGRVMIQSFPLPSAGIFRVTVYSNNQASAFTLQSLLGRNLELEIEDNSPFTSAGPVRTSSLAGGFQASIAGNLDQDEDWHDLGVLAAGNQVNFSLAAPASSTLAAGATELALFKAGDSAPRATATGSSLVHAVAEAGRYAIRMRVPDLQGRYLRFTGGTDRVDLGNPVALQITGSQTIEFWVRPDHFNSRQNPYAKAYSAEGTITQETNGILNYFYGTNGGDTGGSYQTFGSGTALRAGVWQHVAVVRDLAASPAKLRWYINGKLTNEANATYASPVVSALNAFIGNGYAGGYQGAIDEVRIWNVARTTEQINATLGTPLTGGETGLAAYFPFSEASGATTADSSPSAITGDITGSVTRAGTPSATLASFVRQGIRATYLLSGTVSDTVAPSVISLSPTPALGHVFENTAAAPANAASLRGNNEQSYLYTVTGSTDGSVWGTDIYTDDSSIAKAAVHAGALLPGELGAVRVTIKPGRSGYQGTSRNETASGTYGSYPGSYVIERYVPATPFRLDGLYNGFTVAFSEAVTPASLSASGSVTLASAGPDGIRGNGDDVQVPVSFTRLSTDHRAFFSLGLRVLAPGSYRLAIATTVVDRAGNALAAPYTADFAVIAKDGYASESGDNNSLSDADPLSSAFQPGTPSGSFTDDGTYTATAGWPFDVELADLDGDGKTDAVVTLLGSVDGISIHPGNGDRTFATPIEFPGIGDEPYDALIADFDNDSRPDIAVVVPGSDKVAFFRNTSTPGAIAFTRSADVTTGDSPYRIAAADINGDGFTDIAVSNYGTNATTGRTLSILLNDGSGGFTESRIGATLSPRVRPWAVALADLNADGKPDLIAGDVDNNKRLVLWLGNGDGTFGAPSFTALPSNANPSSIAVADFNADGRPDVAYAAHDNANYDISVLPGNGDGTFGTRAATSMGYGYYSHFLKSADLNADGRPDLILGGNDHITTAINRADGSLSFDIVRRNHGETYGVAAADLDGDGVADLAATDHSDSVLRVFPGLARAPLAADDTLHGLRHAYGRGFLTDGADFDYFSFNARRGEMLTVAVDNSPFSTSGHLLWRVYNEAGNELTGFYNSYSGAQGQNSPLTIPRDGTYYVRVDPWYQYYGEYRFRVSLMPPGTQLESEDNNSTGQSDPVSFTLAGNQLSATMGGYLAGYDTSGDHFNLGNLAAGTQVSATLRLPSTSTLTPVLTLYKNDGTQITPDTLTATQLVYTLKPGDESTYHLRVTGGGRGLMAEYLLDLSLSDIIAPLILADTLPAEASAPTFFGSSFSLTFSEDMLASTVNNPANYQLVASGGDGTFGDGNEVAYTIVPGSYSSGLSNSYSIPDGPMQPDSYRLTVSSALRDKLDNPLAADYVRTWTITTVPGYVLESRSNNSLSDADPLSSAFQPGTPSGSFTDDGTHTATAGWPFDVELADLDGDGKTDAVVTLLGSVDGISIHPGNGDRTFATPIEFPGIGDEPYDALIADFDNDSRPDIAVVVPGSDKVAFFRNTSTPGAIAFTRSADVTTGDSPYRIAAADINGDGFTDIAVSNYGTNATTGRTLSILLNDGSGGFTESRIGATLSPRVRPWAVALADLNADGKPDLIAGDVDNNKRLVLWLGNGDGTFGAPSFTALPSNANPSSIAVADFNADGRPDVAYAAHDNANYDISVLPGNGDGTFGTRAATSMGYGYYSHFLKSADLNADGRPDLILGGNDHITTAINRADGSLSFDIVRRNHGETYGVAAADLDGDGVADLAATDHSDSVLRVFPGLARAPLAADDTLHGLRHAYGRGFLTDGADFDYFSFNARRGEMLTVAVDNSPFSTSGHLLWRVYNEAGNELTGFYNSYSGAQGQNSPLTIPRDGTYYVRVDPWYQYYGEYRFRVSLMPPGTQLESEDNNSTGQSDPVSFTLAGNQLSATMGGYLAGYDTSGDHFNLGNLAAGTQVSATLRLPSTSTLTPVLTLYKNDGTQITPDTLTATQLVYTLKPGDESTYHLRVTGGGRGLMAEYLLDLSLSDIIAPLILADTLPAEASADLISTFSLTFNKDMDPLTVNTASVYSLLWAGQDGIFATGDDQAISVVPANYTSGLSNSYSITGAPLRPGDYRLTVSTALRDKFGNPLPLAYQKNFTVRQPAGFATETEPNDSAGAASVLALNDDIPGYLTGSARGILTGGNTDFWTFEAQAGDRLVFETHLPYEPAGYRLNWRLTDPDGTEVFNRNLGTSDIGGNAPIALTKTGSYHIRINDYNGVRTEHRFRVTLLRGMVFEQEPNDTIATSSPATFSVVNEINTASTAGLISASNQVDYINLGTVQAGSTVFLTVRRPSGSILAPIVSLYNAGGILQAETNGTAGDDTAEVQVTTTGTYHALIRANVGTHGLNGDYILDARVVPTSSVNFPNLRVTRLDDITTPGLRTGDDFTLSYDVRNVGTLGTGAAAWVDRVVLSTNQTYGDADDVQLVLIPRSGALPPSQSYTVTRTLTLPHGLPGSFHILVKTDTGNAVDEALFESDNITATANPFNVTLRGYPDLVVEDLEVSGPDGANLYTISWNLANRGSAEAPAGHATRVQVLNSASGQVLLDANQSASSPIAAGGVLAQSATVTATAPGFHLVTVSADATSLLYEYGAGGHSLAEQNDAQANFQIFRFHQIQVSASPAEGGSVTGGGSIRDGLIATVTAVADTSVLPYTFVNWTENGAFASNQPSYSFTATANRNLVAVFTLPQIIVNTEISPAGAGTVSGAGGHPLGAAVSLTPNPAAGYLFEHWEEGSANLGATVPLTFTAAANRTIRAVFREANPTHVVTFATDPAGITTLSGAGTYNNGQSIDVTAPMSVTSGGTEYLFQNFRLNGSSIGTGNRIQKTFTTADPATFAYVAVYTQRSFKPVVTSVTTNFGSTVPVGSAARFTVNFDRDMNTAISPALALTHATATGLPAISSGSWQTARQWLSGPVTFTATHGGNAGLTVTLATDTNARVMDADSSFAFYIDTLSTISPLTISPPAGTYTQAIQATITTSTTGATIYYTLNGSDPTNTSPVYGGPITINADTTLKARAYKAGFHASAIATAVYEIDAEPPVISGLAWEGSPLADAAVLARKGTLTATATDNEGIARAEFFYIPSGSSSRTTIANDTIPADGLTGAWDLDAIPDGAYTVIARVYDTAGTWAETSRSVQVTLAPLPAPQIVQPATGSSVQDPTVALRIQSVPNANIRVFRGGSFIFSGYASAAGILDYGAPLPEGPSVFTATAQNRAGASTPSAAVTVTRVREFPQLVISFGTENTLVEGGEITGTISIPAATAANVSVNISTDKAGRVPAIEPVIIPAGSTSATFILSARQNSTIELFSTMKVFATAMEHRNASAELFLADDDTPDIQLVPSQLSVSESHGTLPAVIRRAAATNVALRVHLSSSDISKASVPSYVDIPANERQATFNISLRDDDLVEGNKNVTLAGRVMLGTTVITETAGVVLEVRDDDGPALALELAKPFAAEGSTLTGTVRRSGSSNDLPLSVSFSQTPGSDFTLPSAFVIPAGQASASFTLAAADNPSVSGSRRVDIRASAPAHTDAIAAVTVTDDSLPELAATRLAAPTTALSDQTVSVSYRIENFGSRAVLTPFAERVLLSTDPYPSPDDLIMRQNNSAGEVPAGGFYERTVPILMPRQTGTYYMIVTVDPANAVPEIDETNNTTVLMQPIVVRPAYSTVVSVIPDVIPANTPIVFSGTATKDNGQPAPFSMVNIHIILNGTKRIISAVTNSNGAFSTTWTPLRNEGGVYAIGAAHPGVDTAPVQDGFEILTLGFDPPPQLAMKEGETIVTQAVLRNPNGRPLTGVSMTVGTLPAGLTITPAVPAATIPANSEITVPLTITAASGFSGNGSFPLTVQTSEGISMQALIYVNIELLRPVLALDPASFDASVLRGGGKSVSLTITNTGGLETGPIQVLLPDIPWMKLVSANTIASIQPGGTASVSLQLAPEMTTVLTEYTGSIALNAANGGSRNVPFRFRVVSDLKGDLKIEAVDEAFFFTAATPKVEGASVIVRDAISSAEIASGSTQADGTIVFNALNEGWYRVEVDTPQHDKWTGNIYVNAGRETFRQVFISRQWVSYAWTVEEVEIQDVYRVSIESTFETNVPAPVVTISPSVLELADLVALGQTKTVNFTIQNHGLINADHGNFGFENHPFYRITPLVENIGLIPAKSTLTVPVVITRVGIYAEDGSIITLDEAGRSAKSVAKATTPVPCGLSGRLTWDYICGIIPVAKFTPIPGSGVAGNCSGPGSGGGGFYGGGWYGGGWGGSGGGGGGGSGSVSFTTPADTECPCFDELCIELSAKANLGGIGEALTGALSAALPPYVSLDDVEVEIEGDGKLCFCCENGEYGFSGSASATATIKVSGSIGFSPDINGVDIEAPGWSNVSASASALAGARVEATGSVSLTLTKECMDEVKGCLSGTITLNGFAGAEIDGSASATFTDPVTGTEIGYSGKARGALGVNVSASASVTGCLDGTVKYEACASAGPEATLSLELEGPGGDKKTIGGSADLPKWEAGSCSSGNRSRLAKNHVEGPPIVEFEVPGSSYVVPDEEILATVLSEQNSHGTGVCATVKIKLDQDVVMTRTAFRGTLELNNNRDDAGLMNVGFDLQVRDENGLPAEDLFNIQITKLTGLSAIDGTGQIGTKSSGSVQWTLIPRDTAAQEGNRLYTIGGVIRYTQDGVEYNIPVENVPITVRPDASLDLKYFHQRDVLSDDPHTDAIEPAQPYKLAVMVENNGFGDARDLRIISGQPQIVENEKGLLIDFKIIGTEVDGEPLSPSLTASFGNVGPGQRKIATWLMTSTLQGNFIDYSATFEHVTGLGDPRLSLMNSVEIHEMIRTVKDQGAGADTAPDFLANDVDDPNDYPDTIHYSHGGTDIVTVREAGAFTGVLSPSSLSITLNTGAFEGWSYIRLPDPANGSYRLASVVRSDGRALPLDMNAWQSDRTFIGNGERPVYEHILHLADSDSPGSYTLTYLVGAAEDTAPPSSSVATLSPYSLQDIPVTWSGTDDTGVAAYNIYVSTDGGAYVLWKERTASTGGIFRGDFGKSYAFYSVAFDNAGNMEAKTPVAEAVTEVSLENLAPSIALIPDATVNEGTTFSYRAVAGDPDGNASDIRFSLGSNHPGITIDPVTGIITWQTSENDGGRTVSVIVVATDSGTPAAVANRAFTIQVLEVNSQPVIAAVSPQTISAGSVLLVDMDATDSDFPLQALTFSLAEAPAGASINASSGLISWSPTAEQADASHLFTVTVADNGAPVLSASTSFSVNVVRNADNGPTFTSVPVVLWTKGQSYTLNVTATDVDGDPITLTANLGETPGATFTDLSGGIGRLSWNTASVDSGVYQVPVAAASNGRTANAFVRIKIVEDNLYWTWVKDTWGTLPEGFDLSMLEMDADPDGDNRGNVHEFALMTNPLVQDSVKASIHVERSAPFANIYVGVHRRAGSQTFVDFDIERSNALFADWLNVSRSNWTATVDPQGDDDGRPESELLLFRIRELHPSGLPDKAFYRIKTTGK